MCSCVALHGKKEKKKRSKELTPQCRQGMPEAAIKGGRSGADLCQAKQLRQEQAEAEKLPHESPTCQPGKMLQDQNSPRAKVTSENTKKVQ